MKKQANIQKRNGLQKRKDFFIISQWNVLAQSLTKGFDIKDEKILEWPNRFRLIKEEIQQLHPDILCMQEMDKFKIIQQNLFENYIGEFLSKSDGHNDGVCIFFKKEKFRKIELKKVFYKDYDKINEASQVAIILILEELESKKKLIISTTHLKAKVGFEEKRKLEAEFLLYNLKEYSELPIIICGDFNDVPLSLAIKTILKGGFKSAYDFTNELYTTFKSRKGNVVRRTIDYIFFNEKVKVEKTLQIPKKEEFPKCLPCEKYPSDHLSIGCDFKLL